MGIPDKIIGYILGALLLALLVFLGEQEISLRAHATKLNDQLTVELQCRVGSTCAQKLSDEAARGSVLVEQARATADTAAKAVAEARDAQAVVLVRRLAESQAQAKADATTWQQKLDIAKKEPDCARWSAEAVACAVH